jgi:hypothetical protein
LRRDGAIAELTVESNSGAGYSSDSNDVSALEAEESSLLEAVPRERLLKIQQAGKKFSSCCGDV